MFQFHKLKLKDVQKETSDAVIWTLDVPEELKQEFDWEAGQHLTFRKMVDGEEIRRSYSIFSNKDEGLKVLIKKIDDGRFSVPAQEDYQAGQEVEVMPPTGHFSIIPENDTTYVGFAAGSGITPVMGMIQDVMHHSNSKFILYYGNSTVESTLLLDLINDLKDEYTDRLTVQFFLSQEPVDVDLFEGRIDAGKVALLHEMQLAHLDIQGYYLCGPGGLIDAVKNCLMNLGVSDTQIHSEQFLSEGQVITPKQKTSKVDSGVQVTIDGVTSRYEIKTGEQNTLLDAALEKGIKMPYSCKAGVCATCRCKLIEGEVDMLNNYSLEDWELKDNYILTCQSVPKTKKIRIDFDS
jgi:ring-1,2-phenylacetyl-CoA epoxidase subunit PaaE